jgi:hypothetical protein
MWVRIAERTEGGGFKIEAHGAVLKRWRPNLDPTQRLESAFLGMIEEAVYFANHPMRTISRAPGQFYWGRSGGVIGVARAARGTDSRQERARAICACLLNASEAYWGCIRLKIAWRLTLLVVGIPARSFTLEAAKALADTIEAA